MTISHRCHKKILRGDDDFLLILNLKQINLHHFPIPLKYKQMFHNNKSILSPIHLYHPMLISNKLNFIMC